MPDASPRLQFRLSTLLWITLAVGCFFGLARYPTPFVLVVTIAALLSPFCTIIACTVADLRSDGFRLPHFRHRRPPIRPPAL